MTNYDKWLAEKQKELDEMTPLLAAAMLDEEHDECYLEKIGEWDFQKCAMIPEYIGCVGCLKNWLMRGTKEC